MIEKIILLFAAMFLFCLILFFCFICLISYGLLYDKAKDLIYMIKDWFNKEKIE